MPQVEDVISDYQTKFRQTSTTPLDATFKALKEYKVAVGKLKKCEAEIASLLGAVANRTYNLRIDLLMIAAWAHPSLEYVENLCKILALEDSSLPNDLIVDLLYENPSAKAIPSLERAYKLKLPHDIYDEFGVKCLDALSAINTPQAWKIICDAKTDASSRLKERAAELSDWHESRRNNCTHQ